MRHFDILFSILTLQEVDFLANIAERLIEKGYIIGTTDGAGQVELRKKITGGGLSE